MSEATEQETEGSNIFAELGLPDSDELMAKARLAAQISSILHHRHLTQAASAEILGVSQPRVSDLLRGRLDRFSLTALAQFLVALGRDVDIVVRKKPSSRKHARLSVTV